MSAPAPETQPIIIKKKVVHGGHHGGAWKVAYADFVTAMMALFIVLWLMNSSQKVQEAVGGYFRDPSGKSNQNGSGSAGLGQGIEISKDQLGALKEKIQSALKQAPTLAALQDQIEMTVTGEGLRIELAEAESGTFFESGNARPTKTGEEILTLVAAELSKLPNKVLTEGHTDARPFGADSAYTNWELSADRANAARRLILGHGVKPEQIVAVRGYADRNLRKPSDPSNPANRRISIVVQWNDPPAKEPAAKEAHGKEASGKETHGKEASGKETHEAHSKDQHAKAATPSKPAH